MKRVISLLLICAMLLAFTSCGSSGSNHTNNTSSTVKTSDNAQSQQSGEPVANSGGKYNEAPQLAALVKEGKLPPVDERLPEEPAVVEVKEMGKYGGVYKGAAFGPKSGQADTESLRYQALLTIEADLQTFKPNIIKDYTVSDDFTTYTIYLRKGMKWSDGEPLTADDFLFWYEDVLLNKDIQTYITNQAEYQSGGEFLKMEKIDDYTVKMTFSQGNPSFEIVMARSNNGLVRQMFAPKHYLSKWHIKYNDKANDLAKEEGFENWFQCFQYHADNSQSAMDTEAPDITPWVLTKIDEQGNKYFDRNPYYYVVDQYGNQLPYIDQQVAVIVKDAEVRTMKLISGELHAAGENPLPVSDYTLYKENEQKGDYTVYLFGNTRGADCTFTFNINHKDPVLNQIFNEVKFREAMSLALNREEINNTLYYGKATVRQALPPDTTSFYEDWMGSYMTEYDPDKANALLDELGYVWNQDHTVRLMPNGKPFNIVLETIEEFVPVCEMAVEYWDKIGIKVTLKQQERTYYLERGKTGERDMQAWTMDGVQEFNLRSSAFGRLRPGNAFDDMEFQVEHKKWFNSNGAEGIEPPEEIKDLYNKCIKFSTLKPGSDEYMALGKEILTTVVKNLWFIGVTVSPRVIIISNRLGNTPTEGVFAYDYNFWKPYRGDTWYFKY